MINQETNFDKKPPVRVQDYDSKIRNFCGAYSEMFKLAESCLQANLQDEAEIMVVGVGTGMEVIQFAPQNPLWSFYGVGCTRLLYCL